MDAFFALSDPTRRRLIARLAAGPLSAGELAHDEPISRPAVSKHLRVLRDSGVVDVDSDGRLRRYRLRAEAFEAVERYLGTLRHPPIPVSAFDALELEVRRTRRERASTPARRQETA